jgi:integrase
MSLQRRGRNRKSGLPPHVWGAPSRHANSKINWYFRRAGKYIPLRGELWSPEWVEDYNAALNGQPAPDRKDRGAGRIKKGTFGDVISSYKQTAAYRKGATGTVRWRNTQLSYIIQTLKLGDTPIASLKRTQLQTLIEKRAEEAWGAARSLLVMFRQLYDRGIAMELVEANLAKGIVEPKSPQNSEGRRDWPETLIEQYLRRHPVGTMARVAIEVFLGTGCRIGDVCRLGWKDVVDGVITDFKTEKTGKIVNIPLHPDLIAALDACPVVGKDSWIVGPRGSLDRRSLRRWFRVWCDEAGIPAEYSAHGLRHTVARRLMDLGIAIEDAMAITGHSDRRVFLHYAQRRDEKLAAKRAMDVYAAAQKNGR